MTKHVRVHVRTLRSRKYPQGRVKKIQAWGRGPDCFRGATRMSVKVFLAVKLLKSLFRIFQHQIVFRWFYRSKAEAFRPAREVSTLRNISRTDPGPGPTLVLVLSPLGHRTVKTSHLLNCDSKSGRLTTFRGWMRNKRSHLFKM